MAMHEIGDPFLACAKISKYLEREMAANVLFVIFAVVFIGSRNIVFGIFLVSILVDFFWRGRKLSEAPPSMLYLYAGLVVLYFISLIWTVYILQIFSKLITEKKAEDVRSIAEDTKER